MRKKQYVKMLAVTMMLAAGMITGCGNDSETSEPEQVTEASTEETAEDVTEETEETEETETTTDEAETEGKNDLIGTFTAKTLEGEDADQEIFAKAEVTMVNIWGTFCGPCISEMPDLGELNKEYADQGFQIVGIISDVNKPGDETAQEIVEKTGADYTHLVASADLTQKLLSRVQAVPTTVFLDSNGNQIGEAYAGAKPKAKWAAIIEELLENKE